MAFHLIVPNDTECIIRGSTPKTMDLPSRPKDGNARPEASGGDDSYPILQTIASIHSLHAEARECGLDRDERRHFAHRSKCLCRKRQPAKDCDWIPGQNHQQCSRRSQSTDQSSIEATCQIIHPSQDKKAHATIVFYLHIDF